MWRLIIKSDLSEVIDIFEAFAGSETFTSDILEEYETEDECHLRLISLGLESEVEVEVETDQ